MIFKGPSKPFYDSVNRTQKVDVEYLREGTAGEGVNRIHYVSNSYLKFQELIQTKSLCD